MFLPLEQAHFSSIIGYSPVETVLLNAHSILTLLRVIPTADLKTGQQVVSSSHLDILHRAPSNAIIGQPGAYTFHLLEEHQYSPTSVGGLWKACNAPMLVLSDGTQVVVAVTREQACCHTAPSLQLLALPGIHPLMELWLSWSLGEDFSELPRIEKAFKLYIQVFL